jgi:hypothetical protein
MPEICIEAAEIVVRGPVLGLSITAMIKLPDDQMGSVGVRWTHGDSQELQEKLQHIMTENILGLSETLCSGEVVRKRRLDG